MGQKVALWSTEGRGIDCDTIFDARLLCHSSLYSSNISEPNKCLYYPSISNIQVYVVGSI